MISMDLIQVGATPPEEPDSAYEDDLHDVNAIIMDMCEALADTKSFVFRIGGFGEERWPVDVATDLSVVLEQLPLALGATTRRLPFELDLYEQGIERRLEFVPTGDRYQITCRYIGSGVEPTVEDIPADVLEKMLCDLGRAFCKVAVTGFPKASRHPWFQEFAEHFAVRI